MKKSAFFPALLLVLIAAAVLGPAVKVATAMTVPNLWGMTLTDVITWILGSGILGSIVLYVVSWLGLTNQILIDVVKGVLLAAVTALVLALVPHIPPDFAGQTVGQLILLVLGSIPAWLGFKITSLRYAAALKAAGADGAKVAALAM